MEMRSELDMLKMSRKYTKKALKALDVAYDCLPYEDEDDLALRVASIRMDLDKLIIDFKHCVLLSKKGL